MGIKSTTVAFEVTSCTVAPNCPKKNNLQSIKTPFTQTNTMLIFANPHQITPNNGGIG